jgi:cytosine/adenosine deaminase-related metal-dependent hydrolase
MILDQVSIYGQTGITQLCLKNDRITSLVTESNDFQKNDQVSVDCSGMQVLPGLINSHEHPDFNLYPQLGKGPYNNYTEWGSDVQRQFKDVIAAVKSVPHPLRVQWGMYKNLLNGFTTLVNHGEKITGKAALVHVEDNAQCLHSTAFEKHWRRKLQNPLRMKQLVNMHIGEGTDAFARRELKLVNRSNWWKRKIVAVHGVAMQPAEAGYFHALVWCPASNIFLLEKTADVKQLASHIPLVFGTDSTLTAPWNLWDHLRLARELTGWGDEAMIPMLTSTPAVVWGLKDRGSLLPGNVADILVMGTEPGQFCTAGTAAIMLVISEGKIKMADLDFIKERSQINIDYYDRIQLGGRTKLVVPGLVQLTQSIRQIFPALEIPFQTD